MTTKMKATYRHKSGNVYLCDSNDEVNRKLIILLSKHLGNRNLAVLVNSLEQRHAVEGTEAAWFISPNPTLIAINRGTDARNSQYQPSLTEETFIQDGKTIFRQFAKVGTRFVSKTDYLASVSPFGEITAQSPFGKHWYVCYQNRMTKNTVFIRNDPLLNRLFNELRREAGFTFVHDNRDEGKESTNG